MPGELQEEERIQEKLSNQARIDKHVVSPNKPPPPFFPPLLFGGATV